MKMDIAIKDIQSDWAWMRLNGFAMSFGDTEESRERYFTNSDMAVMNLGNTNDTVFGNTNSIKPIPQKRVWKKTRYKGWLVA